MAVSRIARLFSVVLAFAAAGSVAAGAGDDALAIWNRDKAQWLSYLKSYRSLGTLHFQSLFQLRRVGNSIELTTDLADLGDSPATATFDDVPGNAEIYVHHKPGTKALERFDLNLIDYPSDRHTVELHVRLEADRKQLMISQSSKDSGATEQVMLDQFRPSAEGPSNFVQLSVTTSALNNAQSDQLVYSSPDFSAFVQTRPDETARYLRPLLRQLMQEMVFAPDQRIAEQVFSSLRRLDPDVQKQVTDLLPKLNDPSFRVRNAAVARLRRSGRPGADVLDRMDRSTLTPEQNVRIGLVLAKLDLLSEKEMARLRADPTFLLDCLYSDQADVRWAALQQLRNVFNPTLEFDPEAPDDVRNALIASLRRKLTPGQ